MNILVVMDVWIDSNLLRIIYDLGLFWIALPVHISNHNHKNSDFGILDTSDTTMHVW